MLFGGEKENECCMFGDIRLPPLPLPPRFIQEMCDLANTSAAARHFREWVNSYNTALAFGALSAGIRLPPGRGPPVVLMNGQQTQQIGNLLPGDNEDGERRDPLFGQVYIIDNPEQAAEQRIKMTPTGEKLRSDVMRGLENLIREHNPFAQRLATLGHQLEQALNGESVDIPPPQHFRLSILDTRPAPGQVYAIFDARDHTPPDPNLTGI
jgi:hypothetical protein